MKDVQRDLIKVVSVKKNHLKKLNNSGVFNGSNRGILVKLRFQFAKNSFLAEAFHHLIHFL